MVKKEDLLSAEICSIIKVSAESGVTELKFGSLHVTFGRLTKEKEDIPLVQQNPTPNPVSVLTDENHKKQQSDYLETEQMKLREEQLARALVEDPVKYEELLRTGDLTDGLDSPDGDEEFSDEL